MKLEVSIAMASNPRTWPILDGSVQADGIRLIPSVVYPSELFWRQLRFADFDVAEMSMSSLLMTVARGDQRWYGLPIFTTRAFFHLWALVRSDANIESPADLKGKRVGVPEYQQTAALWTRGILQHEYGVHPSDMEFWMERLPHHSHAGAVAFTPPPGVTIHQIPHEKNIGEMMLAGELEATLLYVRDDPASAQTNIEIDRSSIDLRRDPRIRPLFRDPFAEGSRFYKEYGFIPINHGMVIRRELAEKYPWAVLNIYKAFERANAIANEQRLRHAEYHLAAGLLGPNGEDILRTSLVRHGIRANRKALETIARYSHEQGLTPRLMRLEEIFAPSVLDQ